MKHEMDIKKYKTVMVVDDNDVDNYITKRIIEASSFAENVITKLSVSSALDYLRLNNENQNALPELILLDIRMPKATGFDFLEAYQFLPAMMREKCKIVVISSTLDINDITKAMSNKQVCKFICKPLNIESLAEINL